MQIAAATAPVHCNTDGVFSIYHEPPDSTTTDPTRPVTKLRNDFNDCIVENAIGACRCIAKKYKYNIYARVRDSTNGQHLPSEATLLRIMG